MSPLTTLEEDEETKSFEDVHLITDSVQSHGFPVSNICIGTFLHYGSKSSQEDGVIVERDLSNHLKGMLTSNLFPTGKIDFSIPRVLVAVLDGHGSDHCMRFIKERLLLQMSLEFVKSPHNWPGTLSRTVMALETKWMRKIKQRRYAGSLARAGTTLTLCLLEGDKLYCCWTGDSPCWIQLKDGRAIPVTTTVHRPENESERERIEQAGGEVRSKVYRTSRIMCLPGAKKNGPLRVYPSGLNISRSIGDAKFKVEELGGKEGIIIAEPEVATVEIGSDAECLVLCTDGLSDNLKRGPTQLTKTLRRGFHDSYYAVKEGREVPRTAQNRMDCVADLVAERCIYYGLKKGRSKCQDNASALIVNFLSNMPEFRNLDL